jgi:hypothetical protein
MQGVGRGQLRAPLTNGNSAITGYEMFYSAGDGWSRYGDALSADCRSITLTGLEAGTRYEFSVKAVNALGASELSVALGAETWPVVVPIRGKVVDADGNGLAGITVTLDNETSATTDVDGTFVIMTSRGDHTLTVSGNGIESFTNNVTVDGLGLDLAAVEASKAAADPPGDMSMLIIVAVAITAVLVGVLGFLRQRRK